MLLATVLGFAVIPLSAQLPTEARQTSKSIGVDVTQEPYFPDRLSNLGITEGTASFLIVVDAQGTKRDHLHIESTHRLFGDEVERVINEWEFTAAEISGERVNAVTRLDVNFRKTGTIVATYGNEILSQLLIERRAMDESDFYYRIANLAELDEIPAPVNIVEPVVPASREVNPDGLRIVYHFFIDEKGRVRIPYLDEDKVSYVEDDILDALFDALMQWEYTPPTIDGQPVVTRASQPFYIHQSKEKLADSR